MRNKSNPARFLGNFARSIFLAGLLGFWNFVPAAAEANAKKTPPPVVHRTGDGNIPEVR